MRSVVRGGRWAEKCAEQANMTRKMHCAVVAIDGTFASTVDVPVELLHACNRFAVNLQELPPCQVSCEILSPDGGTFRTSTGYRHPVDGSLKELPSGTVVFFPGLGLPEQPAALAELVRQHSALGAWLKRQHAAGCSIATWGSGGFLLAEHGLLPGGRATTCWFYADLFRARYPGIELDVDAPLVEDAGVLLFGGPVCGVDAVLTLIERSFGSELTRLLTKITGFETRPPSQLRYEKRQRAVHEDALVEKAVHWIRTNLHTRLTMEDLLRRVPTSRRNLTRRFRIGTGESVQAFIQRLRMDRAKLLLETSALQIEQIVDQIGYQDASAFARRFKRHTRFTPLQYRQRYGLSHGAR